MSATVEATPIDQRPARVEEEGFKLFAGNLTYGTDEAALRAFFAPVASDIVSCVLIERWGRSAGYGFVNVKTLDAANKAVAELDKKELEGRPVIVEIARTSEEKSARRENRPKKRSDRRGSKAVRGEVSEAEANGEAAGGTTPAARVDDAGAAEAAVVKPKKRKSPRKKKAKTDQPAVAAAEGEQAPPADPVAAASGERPPRKPRYPKGPHRPRRAPGEEPLGSPSKSVLFVANLAFSVDEEVLSEFFTKAGVKVTTSRVVRRRWGNPRRSKGYGFVDVGDEAEQQKAIAACNGKSLAERDITVKVAVDAKPHADESPAAA